MNINYHHKSNTWGGVLPVRPRHRQKLLQVRVSCLFRRHSGTPQKKGEKKGGKKEKKKEEKNAIYVSILLYSLSHVVFSSSRGVTIPVVDDPSAERRNVDGLAKDTLAKQIG
eukprot:1257577-Rhodomonas_salina.1